jgi:hypothetical protein
MQLLASTRIAVTDLAWFCISSFVGSMSLTSVVRAATVA